MALPEVDTAWVADIALAALVAWVVQLVPTAVLKQLEEEPVVDLPALEVAV